VDERTRGSLHLRGSREGIPHCFDVSIEGEPQKNVHHASLECVTLVPRDEAIAVETSATPPARERASRSLESEELVARRAVADDGREIIGGTSIMGALTVVSNLLGDGSPLRPVTSF
jgi:hypothetical protein